MAASGPRCCTQAFSSCGKWGPLFTAVIRPLIAVAPPVAEHGVQARELQYLRHAGSVVVARGLSICSSRAPEHRLSSCGSRAPECRLSSCGARAQLLRGMWDPPGPGLEPVSPALAGRPLTTAPPGKSPAWCYLKTIVKIKKPR